MTAKDRGLILINTGPGKGKTTAALGTAIRSVGHERKVAFLQFIKSQATGESVFLEELAAAGRIFYRRLGLGLLKETPSPADKAKAEEALAVAQDLVSQDYDLVVLDEICVAMAKGLIEIKKVCDMLKNKPQKLDVILTGRNAPPEIIDLADTVSSMEIIKHAFKEGIAAKKGIEF